MIKTIGVLDSTEKITNNIKRLAPLSFKPHIIQKSALRNSFDNNRLTARIQQILFDILPCFKSVALNGGDYLYQPGDHVDFLYFPETAVVSEFQILEDGRTVEIAMTGSEGVLGLLPLFDSCRAANWTQVAIGGKAFKIDSRSFEQKIMAHRSFHKLLFEYVNNYVSQISHRAVCNSHHLIEQRFCSWLLMLQNRKNSSRLSLTQEQIARSLGVHRPTVTNIAQTLRTKKIIDYVRGNIYILDRQNLERTACSCFTEINKHSGVFA